MTRRTSHPRMAFTIIEILVVVAIIATLLAIVIASVGRVKSSATHAAALAQLNALQSSINQYHSDFGVYPSSTTPAYTASPAPSAGIIPSGRGPALLAQTLMGYLPYDIDGCGPKLFSSAVSPNPSDPTFGFRTRQSTMGGRIYGPYAASDPAGYLRTTPGTNESFIDRWGNEILYFRSTHITAGMATPTIVFLPQQAGSPPAAPTQAQLLSAYFVADDNLLLPDNATKIPDPSAAPPEFFKLFCSNVNTATPNNYAGGTVSGSDSYLLISAGPDGVYFTADDIVIGSH